MTTEQNLNDVVRALARISEKGENPMAENVIADMLSRCMKSLRPEEAKALTQLSVQALEYAIGNRHPDVTEVRPQVLECDVVRFQNNKEKWVALVGLLDGRPYEIFTGLQDDDEGIVLPKTVTRGKILKQVNPDGTKRYISSSRTSAATRPPSRDSRRSSTPSTGTMPSSSPACCATACPSITSSSSWPRCSCRTRTSTRGRLALSAP